MSFTLRPVSWFLLESCFVGIGLQKGDTFPLLVGSISSIRSFGSLLACPVEMP